MRETEEEAWAAADRLISRVTDDVIAEAQHQFTKVSEFVGQKRISALHQGRRDRLVVAPNLWAGLGLVRGGAGTALVGSAENVAARIREYQEIGVETFITSAYPHLEEIFNVSELLFPQLGIDSETAPAERGWDIEFGRGVVPLFRPGRSGCITRQTGCADSHGWGDRHALIAEHSLRPLFGLFETLSVPTAIYAAASDFKDDKIASDILGRVTQAVDQAASA